MCVCGWGGGGGGVFINQDLTKSGCTDITSHDIANTLPTFAMQKQKQPAGSYASHTHIKWHQNVDHIQCRSVISMYTGDLLNHHTASQTYTL